MSGENYNASTLSLNSLNLSNNDLLNKDTNIVNDDDDDDDSDDKSQKETNSLDISVSIGSKTFVKDDIHLHKDTPSDDDVSNIANSFSNFNSNLFLPKNSHKKVFSNQHYKKTSQNFASSHQSSPSQFINPLNDNNNHIINQSSLHNHNPSATQSPLSCATIYNNHHLNEWVSLNVGGQIFTTTKMTLIAQESDSMLARMFDSDWNHWRDETGAILIDRSPRYFEAILNYLRTGEVLLDEALNPRGVLLEAKFYGLSRLVDELTELIKKRKTMKNGAEDDDGVALSRREFLKLIVGTDSKCELRCQGINLEGSDLSKLDLRNINFKFANMKSCNLSFCNLSRCNFERADLSDTLMDHSSMSGCRMLCTNLQAASMKDCNFQDAGETHTCLQGANMKRVDLEGSRMAAIDLRVANLKNSNLQNCDLRGAILAGTDLENCNLSGCDLQDANLRGANLKGAAFELMLNPLHMSQAVR